MDRDRENMHKILDNEADEGERSSIARSMEADPDVRGEFNGLLSAVRMLEESERKETSAAFTAGVMKNIPHAGPTVAERLKEFLLESRVLRWNMASALAAAVIVVVTLAVAARMSRELPVHRAATDGQSVTVRLTFYSPQARSVAVAGDFNKWKTDVDAMQPVDGMWNIELKLKPGVYTYSFIVDGNTWVSDPGAGSYQDDGFGSRNAVMRVNI